MQYVALANRSPDRRAWRRAATLAWALFASQGVKNVTIAEFDPYLKPVTDAPPVKASWQTMLAAAEAITKRMGGKDLRKK